MFEIGDIVLAKRAVKLNKARRIVDKIEFEFTGPWDIIRKLKGGL